MEDIEQWEEGKELQELGSTKEKEPGPNFKKRKFSSEVEIDQCVQSKDIFWEQRQQRARLGN